MPNFDVNNFVIDRAVRGMMVLPSTGEIAWSVNQIQEPSISCTSETGEAVDAMGTPIVQFDRAKQAEFSANNSLFDLNLAAAQFGTEKSVADAANKVVTPGIEIFNVTAGMTTVNLKHTPVGTPGAEITAIYELKGDETLGTKYTLAATASPTNFELDGDEITLPTGLAAGSRIFVRYEYESERAVEIVNSAVNFPKAGEFILEVLGCDPCNVDIKYYAYIIFPNAKLKTDVDLTFTTEGNHPFSMTCMQDYCDTEKRLFKIIVPDLD